jgi:hypothetical protein
MLTEEEHEILKQSKIIELKIKKQKQDKELEDFEKAKEKMFYEELDNLNKQKQKCDNKINNINDELQRYKLSYIKKIELERSKIEQCIQDLGNFKGQCLHKKKKARVYRRLRSL